MGQIAAHFAGSVDHQLTAGESEKRRELQDRIDHLLSGDAQGASGARHKRHPDTFSSFLPSDQQRASALAALCMKVADEEGGLRGLELAINQLYERLGRRPVGMVQYATKLFLTQYRPAREHLVIRSLEERQPAAVSPSR